MNDKKILIESQFLPNIFFFACASKDLICIEAFENYQKGGFRNSCQVLGANGIQLLSVPLKKGKNQQSIKAVQISYDSEWEGKFLHSIRSAYSNAPYFDYYYDPLAKIIKTKYDKLFALNDALLLKLLDFCKIESSLIYTKGYVKNTDPEFIDFRNLKKTNLSSRLGILSWSSYLQVFVDKFEFHENLSIIDLLFNIGPETNLYLKNLGSQINEQIIQRKS